MNTLQKRIRSILLSYGEPLPVGKIVTAVNKPKDQVIEALKGMEDERHVQVGVKGWRAL